MHVRESGKPSPKFERILSQNGEMSYFYALRILRGRFETGEKSISESPVWAVKYARFIVKNRFHMAEENIAKDPESCYEYFKHVMKGRRLPEKMHHSMLLMSFEKPEDPNIKRYISESEDP